MIRVTTPAPSFADLGVPVPLAQTLAFHVPFAPPAGADDLRRDTYQGGRPLDLWHHARTDKAERRPGILFVHGGGWMQGSPVFHRRHAWAFAARGWVTAMCSYRLTGEAPWPACLEDVVSAVGWLRASADRLGLDPDRIAVAGDSAGGHLAAMAALVGGADVQAVVMWYPVLDLSVPLAIGAGNLVDGLLPGHTPDDVAAASALPHVRPGLPPMLTLVGDDDAISPLWAAEKFHAALDEAGVANELVVYAGRSHGFHLHPADWPDSFERAAAFLAAHLSFG